MGGWGGHRERQESFLANSALWDVGVACMSVGKVQHLVVLSGFQGAIEELGGVMSLEFGAKGF